MVRFSTPESVTCFFWTPPIASLKWSIIILYFRSIWKVFISIEISIWFKYSALKFASDFWPPEENYFSFLAFGLFDNKLRSTIGYFKHTTEKHWNILFNKFVIFAYTAAAACLCTQSNQFCFAINWNLMAILCNSLIPSFEQFVNAKKAEKMYFILPADKTLNDRLQLNMYFSRLNQNIPSTYRIIVPLEKWYVTIRILKKPEKHFPVVFFFLFWNKI